MRPHGEWGPPEGPFAARSWVRYPQHIIDQLEEDDRRDREALRRARERENTPSPE
jgi:hypothetical protein